ncbi:MAG: hypothetical protein HY053_03150 [Proteobacteria bacterium]|nr:hypothetical protein [Pseudomonadota bacterium]
MSVCIYLFRERIIYWTPQTLFNKPASVGRTKWYIINEAAPIPLNEMVQRGNVGYTQQEGFYTVEGDSPADWDERINLVKKIQIIGGLNTLANNHKSKYTDNSLGQALADILLLDEIREYRRTNSLENCAIITSLLETSEARLTPDALVTKLWLQYESYRTVIAYLNHLESSVRQLLKDDHFDKANELLGSELEKLRT